MHNLIGNVFKVVVISIILMCVVATCGNLYVVFSTRDKINAVGEAMKTEMSKNNSIMQTSMLQTTGREPAGYLAQLAKIEEGADGAFVLKGIEVVKMGEATGTVLTRNIPADGLDLEALKTLDVDTAVGGSQVGEYGEFYTIKLTYDVKLGLFAPVTKENWESGEGGTARVTQLAAESTQTFEYTVPCLRYIK